MNRRACLLGLGAAAAARPAAAQALSGAEREAILGAIGAGYRHLDDAALLEAVLRHARLEAGQRVRPSAIDRSWTVEPPRRDLAAELDAARQGGRLAPWLASLGPMTPAYQTLAALRTRYAGLAPWASVAEGPPLRVGDRDDRVPLLRSRLAAQGYGAAAEADPRLFDLPLEAAVTAFQANHALSQDGVVGPATRSAMNISLPARLDQLEANLERCRWMPRAAAADRVEVDTGLQEAVAFGGGAERLRMRAIVGAPAHPTPIFQAEIVAVVLNPPWNVPDSIARNELLPVEAKRPGALAAMGIRWVHGRLQQRPGPQNALGVVKLEVRSPFGVHLHDTPGKALFEQPVRAYSHGCMRLARAQDMALALLSAQGVGAADLAAGLAEGATRRLALRRPVPLIVSHTTAAADTQGRGVFRPDVYGWDRKLAAAFRQES